MHMIYYMSPLAQADHPEVNMNSVPLPSRETSGQTRELKYPWKSLQVGHAFVVEFEEASKRAVANRMRVSALKAARRIGSTLRVYVHDEHKCIEVARVA